MDIVSFLKNKIRATDTELHELMARYGDLEKYNTISLIQALVLLRTEQIAKRLDKLEGKNETI